MDRSSSSQIDVLQADLNQQINVNITYGLSLSDITFPSLILCNVNQVTASFLWKLDIQAEDDQKKKLLFNQFLDGVSENDTLNDANNATLNEIFKKMEEKFGWTTDKAFYKIASQNCRFETQIIQQILLKVVHRFFF